jgi:hypothetical protein
MNNEIYECNAQQTNLYAQQEKKEKPLSKMKIINRDKDWESTNKDELQIFFEILLAARNCTKTKYG